MRQQPSKSVRPRCRCRTLSSNPLIAYLQFRGGLPEDPDEARRKFWSMVRTTTIQFLLVIVLLLLAGAALNAGETPQQTEKKSSEPLYTFKADHDPNGIGKFYRGREIAQVMSFHGAPWLERANREDEERLSLLIKGLELEPGMVVADIGAGSGVISVLMAEKVGPEGKVMAVDIQKEMLDLLREKTKQLGVTNVVPVLGTIKNPKLKDESVDLAVMVDVYHEFEFPYEMTKTLAKSLKTGGRMVLVEYRKEDPRVPIKEIHKMSEEQVKKELSDPAFNLKYKETIDILPRQHILVFEKQAEPKQ